jgi:hypothetical protein
MEVCQYDTLLFSLYSVNSHPCWCWHRLAVENPPMNPGLFGSLLPWGGSGMAMKAHMLLFRHVSCMLCLSRDRSQECNRVEISSEGEPVIHYTGKF